MFKVFVEGPRLWNDSAAIFIYIYTHIYIQYHKVENKRLTVCNLSFLVITIRSFPQSLHTTQFVRKITRWVPVEEQEIFTLLEFTSVFRSIKFALQFLQTIVCLLTITLVTTRPIPFLNHTSSELPHVEQELHTFKNTLVPPGFNE